MAPVNHSDSDVEENYGVDDAEGCNTVVEAPDTRLQRLAQAVVASDNRDPWCTGTFSVPQERLYLFFKVGTEYDAKCIHVPSASSAQLDELAAACDRATFGINQQDVYDETYRKARKLDVKKFSMNIHPKICGLANLVKSQLLRWEDEKRAVAFELYKLNVYGQDSFFKAHKDTPRGEKMFGSLVVVLPTPHQGGGLVLRHNGQETIFDSAEALKGKPAGTIAYAAFYSDVEHEVQKVESGHRITLTYNLFFVDSTEPRSLVTISDSSQLSVLIKELLADREFLPSGGVLGFGLKHEYPVEVAGKRKLADLVSLKNSLKGVDAAVAQAWVASGLNISLKLIYDTYLDDDEEYLIMCDQAPSINSATDDIISELRWTKKSSWQPEPPNGKIIKSSENENFPVELPVIWVTPLTKATVLNTPYVTYGNEASLDYLYGQVALIVTVGPYGKRIPEAPRYEK